MSNFAKSHVNNTASIGHGGNIFPKPQAEPTITQSLSDLIDSSNHSHSVPLISTLSQIFSASQASPFTGLESTGFLKLIAGEGLGILSSAGKMRSIFGSLPGMNKGSGRGR